VDPSRPGTIRVLIADDEAVLRAAMIDLVTSDDALELVGAAKDADEAIAMAEATGPDVALVDVRMPGGGGLRVVQELRERSPSTRVIAHSLADDRATIVRMLRAGAVGYLVKGTSRADILDAIRGAARGQPSMSPHVMADLVHDLAVQLDREESAATSRLERVERIRRAIAGEGRSLLYQPILELGRSTLVGAEALARFEGGSDWSVPRWFAEAARVDLGVELELACAADALAGLDRLPGDAYLSVNVSHRTAGSEGLVELLDEADRIVVEITEHERVDDYDPLVQALARIRDRGARVAIDDAGAGFASLRHLLLIDPEIIKLDVSLTRGIDSDARKRALAAALTSFAEEIDKVVVAEGIETARERETLLDLGVRYGQGYLLGRPVPLQELVEGG